MPKRKKKFYLQKQLDEILVLQSIYGKDFKADEDAQNDLVHPKGFSVKLHPLVDMSGIEKPEIYVSVQMNVKYPKNYPAKLPMIEFSNLEGIGNEAMGKIRSIIYEMAEKKKGEVMIYELCIEVQEQLIHLNRPAEFHSFYDGMIHNNLLKKQKEQGEHQLMEKKLQEQEERENKEILEKLDKRRAEARQALRSKKHEQRLFADNTEQVTISKHLGDTSIAIVRKFNFGWVKNISPPKFVKLQEISCNNNVSIYGCMLKNELATVTEWRLDFEKCSVEKSCQISLELERVLCDFDSLKNVKHSNILQYLYAGCYFQGSCLLVGIWKKHDHVLPVSRYVRNNNPGRCPLSVIKLMAKDILQALRFLHDRNITHDAITLDCLWEGGHQFFLSDFAIAHQLNCIQLSLAENGPVKNVSNRVEDVEYAKSDDVSALGFCIVELAVGVEADHIYLRDRIASIIRPLKNLINLMVAKRRSERWTCELLLSHALLTSDVNEDGEKNDRTNSQFSHADLPQSIHDVSSIDCYEQSKRIESEFQVLKVLGRGGFGDVLKVKNKLDRCQYALKRVPLSTGDISQSRKILREVKLLSQLNHDNVVRYYNSWIETVHLKQNIRPNDCTESYSTGSGEQQLSLELLNLDVKTQTSANSSSFIVFEDEHNDDNEIVLENNDSGEMSSIDDLSNEISMENDDDDDSLLIAFENGDEEQQQSIDENSELDSTVVTIPEMIQILYIQMEICEKSTLRLAIDNGELFVKPDRAWRFFREILEGLTYIHSKGCIHRDLKPSNIFISLNDQAKIGDFGLAISGQSERFGMDDSQSFTLNESDMKDTTISNVGTALYMSPEMSDSHRCSAKVDIYSLGIILFEMFYPMKTSMQRADVLVELRKPEIIIPDDFLLMSKSDELKKLLKLMLDHRSDQRPSSAALLNSELLPISEMEPFEFHYNLNKVLANCCSSNMKQLFSMIFSKSPSAIEEYLYDDQLTCYFKGNFQDRLAMCRTKCETKLAALFHLFGGVHVNAPLLVPRTRILSESYPNRMELVNTDGMVLNLPYDLRYNFARFAARQKIMRLKRYEIGTVFRQRENPMNPQELLECAFDILAPQPDFTHAIVELFSLISAVVDEFSFVKYSDLQIKINHLGLLKAFMENSSVTESSMQQKFLETLSSLKSKFQREYAISDLLKEWKITAPKLVELVSKERCLSDALQWFAQDAQQYEIYLSELKRIISMAEMVCGQLAICVDFGYVVYPNIYTDVVFCVTECRKLSKLREDCVAIGGCYSNLMRNLLGPGFKNQPVPLTAVGLSFWFDRLFFTLAQDTAACEQNLDSSSRVLIISIGQDSKIEQKFRLMKMLRANKIPTDCWYESSESLDQAICWARRMYIGCVILLKAGDPDLRVKMIEKDRVVDRRVSMAELVPFLLERNSSAGDSSTAAHDNSPSTSGRGSSHQHHQSSLTNLNWHFVTAAPLTAKLRRGCEDRVSLMLFPFLNAVNFQHSVPVIVTDMPALIVRDFGSMNMETEATFNASIVQLIEIRQHYKKQILSVGSIIIDELFKSCHAFVLFASTADNIYQILHR